MMHANYGKAAAMRICLKYQLMMVTIVAKWKEIEPHERKICREFSVIHGKNPERKGYNGWAVIKTYP